jgi:hypothetical protein
MRQDAEFFEDRTLALVFIGKRLSESKTVEQVLSDAGIDYAVEVDYYTGGVIFRRERAGAFFYVDEGSLEKARAAMRLAGHKPFVDEGS